MSEHIVIETLEDGIAGLRLARAPVNALTPKLLFGIAEALNGLAAEDDVGAVVLTGTGRSLSAGMDLKELLGFDLADQTAMVDGLNTCYATAYEFPKPLITAANGHAIAGGLFFVLVGDYRVVSKRALLGLTEVRVGVSFPVVASALACHELGANAARRIMLSGENVTAAEALALGFVDEVVAPDDVAARALAMARQYRAIPPQTYASVKAQVRGDVVAGYRKALTAGDPALDGWFNDETLPAATALLAAATGKGG